MAALSEAHNDNGPAVEGPTSDSFSNPSEEAQTASEYAQNPEMQLCFNVQCAQELIMAFRFIINQLKLEADAREALPYVRHDPKSY